MQCDQFHLRLDELLDRRRCVESDEALKRHAAVCPACAAARTSMVEVVQAYALISPKQTLVNTNDAPTPCGAEVGGMTLRRAVGHLSTARLSTAGLVVAASCLLYFMLPGTFSQTEIAPEMLAGNNSVATVTSMEDLSVKYQSEASQVGPPTETWASTTALLTTPISEGMAAGASSDMEDVDSGGHDRPTTFVHQPLISIRLLSQADWSKAIDHQPVLFGSQIPEMDTAWIKVVSDGMLPVQQSMSSTLDLIRRSITSSS